MPCQHGDAIVAKAPQAAFSDLTLAGIPDASGITGPVMESKAVLVVCKKAPPKNTATAKCAPTCENRSMLHRKTLRWA